MNIYAITEVLFKTDIQEKVFRLKLIFKKIISQIRNFCVLMRLKIHN